MGTADGRPAPRHVQRPPRRHPGQTGRELGIHRPVIGGLDPGERERRDAQQKQWVHASAAVAQIDPDENKRDPGDIGKVHLPLQQGRYFRVHGRPSLLGVRRASGSKRRTRPNARAINPNNVPSMMTAPTPKTSPLRNQPFR